MWDLTKGKVIKTLRGHKDTVTHVLFSHDDKYIVSACEDKTVVLRDAETLAEVRKIGGVEHGHNRPIQGIDLSKDDKVLVTGSSDKLIMLWNFQTGEKLKELKGHLKDVFCVQIFDAYEMGDQEPFEKI